jgi:N4-gp56 family major capsid protein
MDENTFKYANFSNEVTSTTARGTSLSGYRNQGVEWQGDLSDAAIDTMYWLDAVDVKMLQDGMAQYIVQKRKYYATQGDITFDTTEPSTSDISNFGTNLVDGVVITPIRYYKAATVSNFGDKTNLRPLVNDKRDELSFGCADLIDYTISRAIGDATETTSTVAGAITLYGGDATSDNTLEAGDVLTTELINEAEVLLSGRKAYYWNSGTWTLSTGTKNPWVNESRDPYVLMIGQRQKQALRNSSQFTNAAEYGNRVVISSGEIGEYLGIRVIVSNNTESVAAAGTAPDGGSAPSVGMTRCILMKGRKAYTFVWGQKPKFTPFAKEWRDQRGIVLTADFSGDVVHADAVVKIDVADI